VTTLKSSLAYFIEPDFGLLDHLLGLHVLNLRQLNDVRSERTVNRRNDALLDLLTSEVHCVKFLKALQRTNQQHVVNFITKTGGQITKMSCLLSYVAHAEGEKRRGGSTLGTGERAQIHLLHPPPQIQKLADRSDVISEVPKNFTGLRPEPGPR